MITCGCGYDAKTNRGMANHLRYCNGHTRKPRPFLKCVCGYETDKTQCFSKHQQTCKRLKFNPNVTYVFDLSDSTMEMMRKHQSNMSELLAQTVNNGTYCKQNLQSKILNEIQITTKYINNYGNTNINKLA